MNFQSWVNRELKITSETVYESWSNTCVTVVTNTAEQPTMAEVALTQVMQTNIGATKT